MDTNLINCISSFNSKLFTNNRHVNLNLMHAFRFGHSNWFKVTFEVNFDYVFKTLSSGVNFETVRLVLFWNSTFVQIKFFVILFRANKISWRQQKYNFSNFRDVNNFNIACVSWCVKNSKSHNSQNLCRQTQIITCLNKNPNLQFGEMKTSGPL